MQHTLSSAPDSAAETSSDDDLAALVLSRRIGALKNRSGAPQTAVICKLLAYGAAVEVPTTQGKLPAVAPELLGRPWPAAPTALKRLGLTQREVTEMAEEAVHHGGPHATLEHEILDAFVPNVLWPVLCQLAWDGPGTASQRVERGLRLYSQATLPANRHRPAGPPARSSIGALREQARALMRVFVSLRTEGHPSLAFGQWHGVPKIKRPSGGRAGVDTSPPRVELVRMKLAELDGEIAGHLGIRDGEDECEAIRRLSPNRLARPPIFRPLRDRVVLILLALTGGRVTAIGELMKSDYVVDHEGVAPDYRHGPALGLRPGKGLPLDRVRWKPLPADAAKRIDAYLLFLERVYPKVARFAETAKDRRGPRCVEPPLDHPLIVGNRIHFEAYGASGIRTLMSGVTPGKGRRGHKALIVREQVGNPDLPAEHRPFVGYCPRSLRHFAEPLAERAGRIWNDEHPPTGGASPPEPGLYASALLDHIPKGDPMRALYGDRATEAAYETLSGRAIELIWELLTTDRGSRKRPDVNAIAQTAAELRAVDGQQSRIREELGRVHCAPRPPLPPKRIPERPPDAATAEELLGLIYRQGSALAASQDLLHVRVDGAETTIRQLLELADGTAQLREHRERLVLELAALIHDPCRWELVPDSAPPGAERVDVDLCAVVAGSDVPRRELQVAPIDRVRDWIIFAELAWACEINNRSTVSRWASGQNLPRVPAHRPWEAGQAPVDCSVGANFRRLWVAGIKDSFWPSSGVKARIQALLGQWPDRQGWTSNGEPGWRCTKPLDLPEPFKSQRAALLAAEGEQIAAQEKR